MTQLPLRAAVIAILFVFLGLMAVHYGAVAQTDGHDRTQVDQRKLASYEDYLGERLYFWATVVEDTPSGFEVTSAGRRLRISGTDVSVSRGDSVQVLGTVHEGGRVTAQRVVVSHRSNLLFLYTVSTVGLLVTIALFYRRWSINWSSLTVVPRS